ncbi:MAG: 2-C-methyl-D-erythritol 2,4-cyclodiphosphate synthase [Bacteroidetes bacterium]|nr:2-C-methyl-D-erythritol 2,4-cyclodiphosphate synthase [Bacteroidota bacterium]
MKTTVKKSAQMFLLPKVGIGYDIHAFSSTRKLYLGGVRIRSSRGLLGHSDADVLLHAICDAILGALALGDIGNHFPPTDNRYKNISSLALLKHVYTLITNKNYRVGNIDATVITEEPKLAPYIGAMQRRIARVLRIEPFNVSIKATTNEQLGALGRKEGCAAIAIALLYMIEHK